MLWTHATSKQSKSLRSRISFKGVFFQLNEVLVAHLLRSCFLVAFLCIFEGINRDNKMNIYPRYINKYESGDTQTCTMPMPGDGIISRNDRPIVDSLRTSTTELTHSHLELRHHSRPQRTQWVSHAIRLLYELRVRSIIMVKDRW